MLIRDALFSGRTICGRTSGRHESTRSVTWSERQ
jgi:hypothetical protein